MELISALATRFWQLFLRWGRRPPARAHGHFARTLTGSSWPRTPSTLDLTPWKASLPPKPALGVQSGSSLFELGSIAWNPLESQAAGLVRCLDRFFRPESNLPRPLRPESIKHAFALGPLPTRLPPFVSAGAMSLCLVVLGHSWVFGGQQHHRWLLSAGQDHYGAQSRFEAVWMQRSGV